MLGRHALRTVPRGLSVVEMMVGVVVGLLVVGAAATMFVGNLSSSRSMLIEARVNQDLRAAADVVVRDLRRAGYWANSLAGATLTGFGTATTPNAYAPITVSCSTASSINFSYSRDTNNTVDDAERFGFRLNAQAGTIEMQVAGSTGWQPLTDPSVIRVTKLQCAESKTDIPVGDTCRSGCNTSPPTPPTAPTAACPNPPYVSVRRYDIVIEAEAAFDASFKRSARESVTVRNHAVAGACPV